MNLGLWICKDRFHLINILLSIVPTSFTEFFQNAANPQQFKQLTAQNRSNFPKTEPNRLCAGTKDHKLDTPWRPTSRWGEGKTHHCLPEHLDPSKKQCMHLASLPSYFPSIFLPVEECGGHREKPFTEVSFAPSPVKHNLSWGLTLSPHTRQKCLHGLWGQSPRK